MGAIVLMAVIVYIFLAVIITSFIASLSKKKPYRNIAITIIFFILLPTWDVALGLIVYYPACLFVPKVAIYETAETDGIYYEGVNNKIVETKKVRDDEPLSESILVLNVAEAIKRGFGYTESKVTEKKVGWFRYVPITPVCYRCTPLPTDPKRPFSQRTNCVIIDRPVSRYMVKVTTLRPVKGVEIHVKEIIDRSTGKLLAESHQVALESPFPFFNWIYYDEHPKYIVCPKDSSGVIALGRYDGFEFRVLKPHK